MTVEKRVPLAACLSVFCDTPRGLELNENVDSVE